MRDEARSPVPPPPRGTRRRPLHAVADKLGGLFGVGDSDRESTVTAMLAASHQPAAGYWLQLLTAMGIATLGLVLGSTAVVIGAMLVSPLMTPIISLGMGLAIGSPVLVVRGAMRVAASVAIVPLSAAAVTMVLPIHELTGEISSRTSPTVLDLAIASCCAVAGVYSAIRPGSDTASTAAGTAIGIALVPPLCVVGYGLGTGSVHVAGGAALLFIANFCAIILFSVLGFTVLGYASVPVATMERAHAESFEATTMTGRVARRLSVFFASKAGPVVRLVMPLALVVLVYFPLRTALAEVTWEIRVRTAVNDALASLPGQTVHSSVRIESRTVAVRVVVVGQEAKAVELRRLLLDRIASAVPGTKATVEITAVPDAGALGRAEAALHARPAGEPPQVVVRGDLGVVRGDVERVLGDWPTEQAGALATWRLVFPGVANGAPDAGAPRLGVEVVHLGAPLGGAAASVLEKSLARVLGQPVELRDVALAPGPFAASLEDGESWLVRATQAMAEVRALMPESSPAVVACITVPHVARGAAVLDAVRSSPLFAAPRASIASGDVWSLRWSTTPCDGADSPDGGHALLDAASDAASDARHAGARDAGPAR